MSKLIVKYCFELGLARFENPCTDLQVHGISSMLQFLRISEVQTIFTGLEIV